MQNNQLRTLDIDKNEVFCLYQKNGFHEYTVVTPYGGPFLGVRSKFLKEK